MKLKHIYLWLFFNLFLIAFECGAQKQDRTWIFGDSSGLDFTSITNPVPISNSSSFGYENCASISDKNGNLLFYLAGTCDSPGLVLYTFMNAYNKLGEIMENGDSIQSNYSQTNGLMIIPFPYDSERYYLFHLQHSESQIQLYYSIIDMSFNNGTGKIISKNSLLSSAVDDSLCEQLAAVKHANGKDWWLVYHGYLNNRIYERLITGAGISDVVSKDMGDCHCQSFVGESSFSIDGSKFITVNYGVADIFAFDRCTGDFTLITSLGDSLSPSFPFYYGCAFSPSGRFAYVTILQNGIAIPNYLFQLDLDQANVLASKVELYTGPINNYYAVIGQLQNGPDNKIYLAYSNGVPFAITSFDSTNMNLSVINEPDSSGFACDFQPFSLFLDGRRTGIGLPNMPNYNLGEMESSDCDTTIANSIFELNSFDFSIFPNPASTELQIKLENNSLSERLKIINTFGQILVQQTFTSNPIVLDIAILSPGVYLIEIQTEKETVVKKFVKR